MEEGYGDVLDVRANYEVRTGLDVSKLTWDRLFDLYEMLAKAGYGPGFAAGLRLAYFAVGQTHFAGLPHGPPRWLRAALLRCVPEYPPGLELTLLA